MICETRLSRLERGQREPYKTHLIGGMTMLGEYFCVSSDSGRLIFYFLSITKTYI